MSTVYVPIAIFLKCGIFTDMDAMVTTNTLEQILDRVRIRREKLGLSEHAAEQAAGAKVGTIRNWRRGAMPRIETLSLIAPALRTTPEWLAYEAGPEELDDVPNTSLTLTVPKISWVSAGAFAASDAVMPTDDFEKIVIAGLPPGEWVALKVDGDSMDRISPPESIILVNRRDKRLIPNACYVIEDGEGGATYKRYRQSPTRFEPVSTNHNHEPIFIEEGNIPRVFGRVGRSYIDM